MAFGIPFRVFDKFLLKRRGEVQTRFIQTMQPGPDDSCLEIGGPTRGMSGIIDNFASFLVINPELYYLTELRNTYTRTFESVLADGRELPVKDKCVDYVFANAVLEHVARDKRELFAAEVRRVSRKGFFLINDNHWFPLDPHYRLPLYQFLPHRFKRFVSNYVSFKWFPKGNYDPIDLLTIKEYKKLFPGARCEGMRFPFSPIAESIIVWDRYSSRTTQSSLH